MKHVKNSLERRIKSLKIWNNKNNNKTCNWKNRRRQNIKKNSGRNKKKK